MNGHESLLDDTSMWIDLGDSFPEHLDHAVQLADGIVIRREILVSPFADDSMMFLQKGGVVGFLDFTDADIVFAQQFVQVIFGCFYHCFGLALDVKILCRIAGS